MDDNGWDPDFLRVLHTKTLEEAQKLVIDLIESGTTKPAKKAHLVRDFKKARSSVEISKIMYNAMLSGSGLGISGSAWSKAYGAAATK